MKRFIILSFVIFGCTQSFSQILYYQNVPPVVLSSWGSSTVHIDATDTLCPALIIWNDFGSQIDVNVYGTTCEVLMSGTYPAALNAGQLISASATWAVPSYAILFDGTNGNWQNKTNKYLGVRVQESGFWYYGWIRMDVNNTGTSATVLDYAIYKPAGSTILAGQMPATTGINIVPSDEVITLLCQKKKLSFIGIDASQVYELALIDMTGKLIGRYEYKYNETIDLSGYATGIYVAVLQNNKHQAKRFEITL